MRVLRMPLMLAFAAAAACGDRASQTTEVALRAPAARAGDAVKFWESGASVYWNGVARDQIVKHASSPFVAIRMLAILGTASMPALAQTAPATPQTSQTAPAAANQAQPAKPQTVKKRVCEQIDEDSYSRLGNRKICKTIEVPVTASEPGHDQPQASSGQSH